MTKRVCVVITARPSYSRIKTALTAIDRHPDLELQLVVAASALLDRYGSAIDQIRADGFEPAAEVFMVLEGENPAAMAKTTGIGLIELASVFDRLRPDLVVSVADRYETMATAVAASYMNIPLVHVQGGEVTGNIDEKVRHAVTKLSDLHLVSTELSRERLIRMGEEPDAIKVTGCPSIDIAAQVLRDPALDFDPFERYGGVGNAVDLGDGYLVVMQHPVTTEYRQSHHQALETLHAIDAHELPALWFWPNVDAGSDGTSSAIREFRERENPKRLHFFKNMAPEDFLRLIANSACLIGNSSVGIRESSFLGVPVVNIGGRQHGRERGHNVVDVDHDRTAITRAVDEQIGHGTYEPDQLYGDGHAGEHVADALATEEPGIEKWLTY